MTGDWNIIDIVQPADAEVVWIRRLLVEYPVLATWSAAAATFTIAGLPALPWYFIARWRSQ